MIHFVFVRPRYAAWLLFPLSAAVTSGAVACATAAPVESTDRVPPVISNGRPTGTLGAGTRQATLAVDTNEPAGCRWGTMPGAGYATLSDFQTTGAMAHEHPLTGLVDGQGYVYYVRCRDQAGNANTSDFPVAFDVAPAPGPTLVHETFEDDGFAARGWYDNSNIPTSTTEAKNGARSMEVHFTQGSTTPEGLRFGPRIQFSETESVYVSFWVKYSANWIGSGDTFHPHEFYIMTNLQEKYGGVAHTNLTAYIEHNYQGGGIPVVAIQDGLNIDQARANQDLTSVTEMRAVAGCNGSTDGYADDCYHDGTQWRNFKQWNAPQPYFEDTPGPRYKNDWHFIEAYFQLNTIQGGIGQTDGVIQYWFDGVLVHDLHDVLLRTGQHPSMKFNQFIIAPYIGSGSPADQFGWFDDLTIATDPPAPSRAPSP